MPISNFSYPFSALSFGISLVVVPRSLSVRGQVQSGITSFCRCSVKPSLGKEGCVVTLCSNSTKYAYSGYGVHVLSSTVVTFGCLRISTNKACACPSWSQFCSTFTLRSLVFFRVWPISQDLYDVREMIGHGTSGEVRRAINRATGKQVAVKVSEGQRSPSATA